MRPIAALAGRKVHRQRRGMISWFRMVAVLGLSGCAAAMGRAETLKAELLRLTERADSLQITAINCGDIPHRLDTTLAGRERVAAFLTAVEFARDVASPAKPATKSDGAAGFETPENNCRCEGQFALTFRRADQELVVLTLHHAAHFRSAQFNHGADAFLTDKSRRAVMMFTVTSAPLPPAPTSAPAAVSSALPLSSGATSPSAATATAAK